MRNEGISLAAGVTAAFLLAALALVLAGCDPAVSVHPLYTEGESKVFVPEVEGDWIFSNLGEEDKPGAYYHVKKDKYFDYVVEITEPPNVPSEKKNGPLQDTSTYVVSLLRLDGKLFFDAEFLEQTHDGARIARSELREGITPTHLIGRLWVEEGFLRLAFIESHWVEEHTGGSFRAMVGLNVKEDKAVITADSETLRKFMVEHADDAKVFRYVAYLCRPETDCYLRGIEDELKRQPNDDELLELAQDTFFQRADYKRALAISRRRLELAPQNQSVRESAGMALLFLRNFSSAREEFSQEAKAAPDDPSPLEKRAWSYFLEGNYSQTAEVLGQLLRTHDPPSADPILLNYFSLLRLGQRAKADEMFASQSSKFVGSSQEHILLLQFAGRISRSEVLGFPIATEQARSLFFQAQQRILAQDVGSARTLLQQTLDRAPKGHIISLAAKVELERLASDPKR